MGNYDRAIADANEAIRLVPSATTGFVNRSAALSAMDEYGRAIADATRAIDLDSNSADAYFARSCHRTEGEGQGSHWRLYSRRRTRSKGH